jgi:hypothetical protein
MLQTPTPPSSPSSEIGVATQVFGSDVEMVVRDWTDGEYGEPPLPLPLLLLLLLVADVDTDK